MVPSMHSREQRKWVWRGGESKPQGCMMVIGSQQAGFMQPLVRNLWYVSTTLMAILHS